MPTGSGHRRLPVPGGARVRVRALAGADRAALPRPLTDALWPFGAGDRTEPRLGQPARRRHPPRLRARIRPQRRDRVGGRGRLRDRVHVQSGLALRPDLAAAHDHRARGPRKPRRRRHRSTVHGCRRSSISGRDLGNVGAVDVLRALDRDPARPPARPVWHRGARGCCEPPEYGRGGARSHRRRGIGTVSVRLPGLGC